MYCVLRAWGKSWIGERVCGIVSEKVGGMERESAVVREI
jgi:hypothetical protein